MAACVATPSKLSHPAQYTYLATPPLTPTPTLPAQKSSTRPAVVYQSTANPVPSYAALRAHHAYAVRHIIAKLRWEHDNNFYIADQDAQWNIRQLITHLETELCGVEEARKGLDKFPNAFSPLSVPAAHGPRTAQEEQKIRKLEAENIKFIDEKLDEIFPIIKQLFIGPMTKQQARNDRLLRDRLRNGHSEGISVLLPSANKRLFEGQKKKSGPNKNYEQKRMDKERAKIAAYLEKNPQVEAKDDAPRRVSNATAQMFNGVRKFIGPLTEEQYLASLPMHGPLTKNQTLHEMQRRQRQLILGWLHKPWNKYDEEAAGLIEKMAAVALGRLEETHKEKVEEKAV
ncbi:uncharacterized protein L203_101511 [Cryptococcus depauperatus CBS 7841]|uniref:Uncharacterized protein n=1 Tax=Cryptococcus depauperatus CBS 7841 TaxID=1295531 RepID=A0A1E3ITC2_9TREE|nr:hypothetical protein L204_05656 [Cryptococcus depauperatus CBS 7855]ODN91873.1 hypothetical protein L203_01127 [Cryptococcus depauperatus CBS 7841]